MKNNLSFRKFPRKKRFCRFCADKTLFIDYKNVELLKDFLSERKRIYPRRMTGTCARHQRELSREMKLARNAALLQYTPD